MANRVSTITRFADAASPGIKIASADYNAEVTGIVNAVNTHVPVINEHDDEIEVIDSRLDSAEANIISNDGEILVIQEDIVGIDERVEEIQDWIDDYVTPGEAIVYTLAGQTLNLTGDYIEFNVIQCTYYQGQTSIQLGLPSTFGSNPEGKRYWIVNSTISQTVLVYGTLWHSDVYPTYKYLAPGEILGITITRVVNDSGTESYLWNVLSEPANPKKFDSRSYDTSASSVDVTLTASDSEYQYLCSTDGTNALNIYLPSITATQNRGKKFTIVIGSDSGAGAITLNVAAGSNDKIVHNGVSYDTLLSSTFYDLGSVSLLAVPSYQYQSDTTADSWVVLNDWSVGA